MKNEEEKTKNIYYTHEIWVNVITKSTFKMMFNTDVENVGYFSFEQIVEKAFRLCNKSFRQKPTNLGKRKI